jgi:hypothetical protein
MGIDIHGWVEIKPKTQWQGVIKIDSILGRNYLMFGCLFDEKCYFESVASSRAPTNTSDEVSYDNAFHHAGLEQCLTYSEIKKINWSELSIEMMEHVYVRDGFDKLHLIEGYELSNVDYTRLQKDSYFEKGCLIFKLEKIQRKDCLTHDWLRLFEFMRILADEFGEENVRLVVWFDR